MRKVEIGRHFEVGMRKWEAEGILEVGSRRSECGRWKMTRFQVSGVRCSAAGGSKECILPVVSPCVERPILLIRTEQGEWCRDMKLHL
jgi:hypothetical protein